MKRPACPLCGEGVLCATSAAERSPLARTLSIVLMALSTPFLFYALKVIENIPAAEATCVVRRLDAPGLRGLLAIAAVPLAGAWALRRKSGRAAAARPARPCSTWTPPARSCRGSDRHAQGLSAHRQRPAGPRARAVIERDARVMSQNFAKDYPLVASRGQGAMVEDVDGNRYLDFAAGIAVASTGHSHPDVVAAIRAQSERFLHMCATDFFYENVVELAEGLARRAPGPGPWRVFFANSGAEVVEARDQAGARAHGPAEDRRLLRRVPRPHLRRHEPDREQARPAQGLRAVRAGGRCTRTTRTATAAR